MKRYDTNNLEEQIRKAARIAIAHDGLLKGTISDAGCGMYNVEIDGLLGFKEPCIVQCYPKGEYHDVYILPPHCDENDESEWFTLEDLPLAVKCVVFEKYCEVLGVEIDEEKERIEGIVYGRDDLLEVCQSITNEYGEGESELAEELCAYLADAAFTYLYNHSNEK